MSRSVSAIKGQSQLFEIDDALVRAEMTALRVRTTGKAVLRRKKKQLRLDGMAESSVIWTGYYPCCLKHIITVNRSEVQRRCC